MTVINKIMEVTQQSQNDERERTIREKFTEFSEHLFFRSIKNVDKKDTNNTTENL